MGEFRVTLHVGSIPDSASSKSSTLMFSSADEFSAWRFYQRMKPHVGTSLALWRPDGTLAASKSGSMRGV